MKEKLVWSENCTDLVETDRGRGSKTGRERAKENTREKGKSAGENCAEF